MPTTINRAHRTLTITFVTLGLLLYQAFTPTAAFLLFEGAPTWGNPTPGTSVTVTWSLMPDGTDVLRRPPVFPPDEPFLFHDFWQGTSNLASIYAQLNIDPAVGETLFLAAVNNAFATWEAVANINFVQVPDAGLPLGFPEGVPADFPTPPGVGDIRIGAFSLLPPFDAFAAHAFEPPGNVSSAGQFLTQHSPSTFGDITLNTNALFGVAPGAEGDPFDFSTGFFNDIEGLLLHEIGHALGLTHPEEDGLDPDEAQAVMFVGAGCCDAIQRQLGVDDIAGIQALYNPTAVPEPPMLLLWGAGLAFVVGWRRRRV